jgi:hypothetical protein
MRPMKHVALSATAVMFAVTLGLAAQQTQPPPLPGQLQPPTGQLPPPPPTPGGRGPQPPPKNLQVLPKELTRQQVTQIMRGFTRALGVRCPYCHVGVEGADLSTFDFASDEKPTKKTARIMLQNLNETNARLASVGDKPAGEPRVSCWTCHRGEAKPAAPPPPGPGRGNH